MMIQQLVDALQPVTTSWQNPRITRQLSWFSSDVCLQKSHLLEFLVLQLGGYQVLGNCHNCQLTLDTFQWPKMMVTLCHLSCFFSLGVRFQDFLHLSLLKGVILGCIFMKLFFFQVSIVSFISNLSSSRFGTAFDPKPIPWYVRVSLIFNLALLLRNSLSSIACKNSRAIIGTFIDDRLTLSLMTYWIVIEEIINSTLSFLN